MSGATCESPDVRVLTSGAVPAAEADRAEGEVRRILTGIEGPASVTVTLTVIDDPALPNPALAQATVEQGLRTLRAQAAARDAREALDLLRDRLARRLAS